MRAQVREDVYDSLLNQELGRGELGGCLLARKVQGNVKNLHSIHFRAFMDLG